MNNLDMNVNISGRGIVIKSSLEQLVQEEEDGKAVLSQDMAVPATQPVEIEKYSLADLPKDEVEGGVMPVIVEDQPIQLKESKRQSFNADAVSNLIRDTDEDDGGVLVNRTAAEVDDDGLVITPGGRDHDDEVAKKYEVSGFMIQYKKQGSKGLTMDRVSDFYDTLEQATNRFNGSTYLMPSGIASTIHAGLPIISYEDRQIREYIDEVWKRC